jgi:putative membrane protein
MYLDRADVDAIDARIAAIEAATGVEIVASVTAKADAYPELPWTAFALGAAFAALAAAIVDVVRPDWPAPHTALLVAVTILGVGAGCALAAVFVPAFARLFLRATRRDLEVRQYAQALFLERELFGTTARTGILLLVCMFERRVELLPDRGFRGRIDAAEWRQVVEGMTPALSGRRPAAALLAGLDALADLLARKGFRADPADTNELPDRTIEAKGE